MKKINLELEQLTCPTCVSKIQNQLDKTEGVLSSKVLFTSSKVKAEIDENILSTEDVTNMIEALGFEVISAK